MDPRKVGEGEFFFFFQWNEPCSWGTSNLFKERDFWGVTDL